MRASVSTAALQASWGSDASGARTAVFVSTIEVPPCEIGARAYYSSTNKLFIWINARAEQAASLTLSSQMAGVPHDPTATTPHRHRDRLNPRRSLRRKTRAVDPRDRQAAHRPC